MQKKIATGKIYLGGSFNREIDHERVERAKEILAKNPTIAKVHFPFDYDFVDPEEKNPEITYKTYAYTKRYRIYHQT